MADIEEYYAYRSDANKPLDVMNCPSKNDNRAKTFEQAVNKLNKHELSTLEDAIALIIYCRRGTNNLQTALATYIGLNDKFYEWADYIMTHRKIGDKF